MTPDPGRKNNGFEWFWPGPMPSPLILVFRAAPTWRGMGE